MVRVTDLTVFLSLPHSQVSMVSFNEAEALKSFAVPLSYLPAFSRAYAARVEASMAGRSLESSQECAHEMKPSTETGDQPVPRR